MQVLHPGTYALRYRVPTDTVLCCSHILFIFNWTAHRNRSVLYSILYCVHHLPVVPHCRAGRFHAAAVLGYTEHWDATLGVVLYVLVLSYVLLCGSVHVHVLVHRVHTLLYGSAGDSANESAGGRTYQGTVSSRSRRHVARATHARAHAGGGAAVLLLTMAAATLKNTGTALVTAPANMDVLVPNLVKESVLGQATGAALRAMCATPHHAEPTHWQLAPPALGTAAARLLLHTKVSVGL